MGAGVYIPNMEKPKECEDCQFYMAFYIEDEKVGSTCGLTEDTKSIEAKYNDCPLIEIDLVRCEECEWSNGECSVGERYQGGCTFGERKK